ncbi:MAG: sigma factor-like helix-turn-helix DNA-binding protein [Candidatus Tectomicrobia bacterium]
MRLDALTVQAALRRRRQGDCSLDESMDTYLPTFDDTGHHRQRPLGDWSGDLESLAADAEGQRLLRHAIVRLPPMEKASLVLRDLEAYSLQDISVMLVLSVSGVKRYLHHARLALRGYIETVLDPTPVA